MKNPFRRDIPPRAAAVIVALALLASVVTGREEARVSTSTDSSEKPANTSQAGASLDLAPLARRAREGEFQDLFTTPVPVAPAAAPPVPVAAARPAPPPAPTAPPLPFKYLGHAIRGDSVKVYLERNQEMFIATAGDTLAGAWRIESIGESTVQFVFLPLGTRQSLEIPSPYSGAKP